MDNSEHFLRMDSLELIRKIDWKQLNTDKKRILSLNDFNDVDLDGTIALFDALQDFAVDRLEIDTQEVFELNDC